MRVSLRADYSQPDDGKSLELSHIQEECMNKLLLCVLSVLCLIIMGLELYLIGMYSVGSLVLCIVVHEARRWLKRTVEDAVIDLAVISLVVVILCVIPLHVTLTLLVCRDALLVVLNQARKIEGLVRGRPLL